MTGAAQATTPGSLALEEHARLTRRITPRPRAWDDVVGNATAVEILREGIAAAAITRDAQGDESARRQAMSHTLLFGPPGMGKTTLSHLVAQEVGGGFVSTTASTLERPADLVRILWDLNTFAETTGKPSVLFIDEIHMLGQARGRNAIDIESVFPLLEDWVFPHNLLGAFVKGTDGLDYPVISAEVPVWPFTCVGATTEPGMLPQALLRRFLLHVELEPYSEADIVRIIAGAARLLEWAVHPDAAVELGKYARCNPGRSYQLLTSAHNRAVATGRAEVTAEVAVESITRLRLYPLGLTDTDVRVLKLLADRAPKGCGQAEICRAIGISLSQFSGMVEPYLRQLGFIETLSRRVIRPEGLAYLARLGEADLSRPEVRAAVGA